MDELIKALRECEFCTVCDSAVDGECPFGGKDALRVAAADAIERLMAERKHMRDDLIERICENCETPAETRLRLCENCPIINPIREAFNVQS